MFLGLICLCLVTFDISEANIFFLANRSKDLEHIFLTVKPCLFICLFVCPLLTSSSPWLLNNNGLKLLYVFGMNTPLMKLFQMTSRLMTLWPSQWPLFLKYLFWPCCCQGHHASKSFLVLLSFLFLNILCLQFNYNWIKQSYFYLLHFPEPVMMIDW